MLYSSGWPWGGEGGVCFLKLIHNYDLNTAVDPEVGSGKSRMACN